MKTMKHWTSILLIAILAVLLTACARTEAGPAQAAADVSAPAPAATSAPTVTPAPTATPAPTPFSMVWMVDTQMYSSTYPDILNSIFQWTADVRDEKNVEALVHSGDVVRSVYYPEQLERIGAASALLPDDLRCIIAAGNHDCGIDPGDYSAFLQYRFDTDFQPENGFEDGVSYYTTFTAGGVPILALSIAYGEEKACVEWARGVLSAHPDHYAILLVHSYLDTSYGVKGNGYTSSGEALRDGVVIPSPNVRLVLCGHMRDVQHSELSLDDDGDGAADRTVIQMMLNPQENVLGGGGFLRLLTFDPARDRLTVETYSPYLGERDFKGNDFGARKIYRYVGLKDYLPQGEIAAEGE